MGDLGDLGGFLKGGSLSDLSWLDVDEEEYRALDRLPKQNLDISPDLQALWSHEDKPASAYFMPNTVDAPRTMGDMSEAHGKLASAIKTAARIQMYASSDLKEWRSVLVARFGVEPLREHKAALKEVLEERGLLGRVYVNASDFPTCYTGTKQSTAVVRKFAGTAPFVVAKPECTSCIHASSMTTGGQTCAVFHKKLVLEVPYSEALANKVESIQAAKGKAVQASTKSPKERVRLAMLATDAVTQVSQAIKPVENTVRLMPKTGKLHLPVLQSQESRLQEQTEAANNLHLAGKISKEAATSLLSRVAAEKKSIQVVDTLRRELLRGRTASEAIASLKVAYPVEELKATRQYWDGLIKQAGLYGTVYTTQDSFNDCREGSDFIAKHNGSIKAVVAGNKCDGCFYNKMSKCAIYSRPLVKQASDLYTSEMVNEVVREHRLAGRLESGAEKFVWGETPEASLREIHRTASEQVSKSNQRMVVQRAFTGTSVTPVTSGLTKREVVRAASKYLNEGLYGQDLLTLLKGRFDVRDIKAAKEELRQVLAEQGLQGIYYVDPSIYTDYGKGCNEAERLHRSRVVPYVKMGSACLSCVHQAKTGHCSKLNKSLVAEIPYVDKVAQQREILASGKSTEVSYGQLMNNGLTVMAEYQMQHGMIDIDLNSEPTTASVEVEFGSAGQGIKL